MAPSPPEPATEAAPTRGRLAVIAVLLAAAAFALYARTGSFDFVNIDDLDYVKENPAVLGGLTPDAVKWAFTESHAANWHPLTWISHMIDVERYGLDAGGHHRTNALLHALGAALLFLALHALTRRVGASLVVAALFAVHPTHVESVAWVSERKDVLSGVFFMLTLLAWASWVRRPAPGRYVLVGALLALGLMAKPMLVVLPPVLLLLDVWPLRRFSFGAREDAETTLPAPRALIVEKLPLFGLAAISSVITVIVQRAGDAMTLGFEIGFGERILNTFVAYGAYLRMSVWPSGLAVYYPHPAILVDDAIGELLLPALLSLAVLIAISWFAWRARRAAPYLLVGWLWFLGTLVPVIGLLQVGGQAYADRYTYLPTIGLYLAAGWGVTELLRRRGAPPIAGPAVAAVALVAFSAVSWNQIGKWRDNGTLFTHAAAVTERNYIAWFNLGVDAFTRQDLESARIHLEKSLEIAPTYPDALGNLGIVLMQLGRPDEALPRLRSAAELAPDDPTALFNYAMALVESGNPQAAFEPLRRALTFDPDYAQAHLALGLAHLNLQQIDEATTEFEATLRTDPDQLIALQNLAGLSLQRGNPARAETCVRRILRLQPNHPTAMYQLGLIHAGRGETKQARAAFQAVLQIVPGHEPAQRELRRIGG